MKREDFKKIIKLRSCWKIDKRMGDYKLPSGEHLLTYIKRLVESQMKLDKLGVMACGDLCFMFGGDWNTQTKEFNNYTLMPAFEDNESCSYDEMEKRINRLARELLY
ncbi:MAG: hypothetical protein MSS65_04780 [Clostridium sp.]|nr:hypothetical protein [Clostridium sp.]